MKNLDHVSKEKLEEAFELIRKDILQLHYDLAGAEGNRMRWIFIIMWMILLNLIHEAFNFNFLYSFLISALLIMIYRFFDRLYMRIRASQISKIADKIVDKKVDLS